MCREADPRSQGRGASPSPFLPEGAQPPFLPEGTVLRQDTAQGFLQVERPSDRSMFCTSPAVHSCRPPVPLQSRFHHDVCVLQELIPPAQLNQWRTALLFVLAP